MRRNHCAPSATFFKHAAQSPAAATLLPPEQVLHLENGDRHRRALSDLLPVGFASIIPALRLPLLMLTVPVVFAGLFFGGGGALLQKRSSDLCCCFSCFDAGPERAVHATRDGPPGPRQPGPSHRAER